MPTFRKKPVEVEAHRLEGDLGVFRDMEDVSLTFNGAQADDPHALAYATVQTEEGPLRAQPGDWIITGVEGECYPCKDRVFRATYASSEGDVLGMLEWMLEEADLVSDHFQRRGRDTWDICKLVDKAARLLEQAQVKAGEAQG